MTEGDYSGQLTVTSNDPDSPTIDVPVNFTVTGGMAPPPAPSLASPDDGSTVSQPVMLDWSDVGGVDMYEVMLSDEDQFVDPPMMDSTMGESECELSMMSEGATYYWKVRAHNAAGWGDWSEVRSFVTEVTWVCGDINNDGDVNLNDITYLLQYLYNEVPAPAIPEACTVNNDAQINLNDAVALINFLYNEGAPPDCGSKVTELAAPSVSSEEMEQPSDDKEKLETEGLNLQMK
jgi:hypothetical protein